MNSAPSLILVPLRDLQHVSKPQLRKAATIARASGAKVELFHAAIADEVRHINQSNRIRYGQALQDRLERWRRSPLLRGVQARTFVSFDTPGFQAVADRAKIIGADLVVAAPVRRGFGSRLALANGDWELIRHCPCPLLLVRNAHPYDRPVVLVAVDPFHAHAKPCDLDRKLTAEGALIANILKGEMHLFHAYMPINLYFGEQTIAPGWIPPELEEIHREQMEIALHDTAQTCGVEDARCHLGMGGVKGCLREAIRETGAQIVAMGAVSRSAFRRLAIGSTAEHVLDSIPADVLIVNPGSSPAAGSAETQKAA